MTNTKESNPKDAIGCKKPPLSTLSMPVLFEAGAAMLEGACKYGRHNYRELGVRASIYYDATMRHLADWWEGQDIDEKSGLHHLTKAIASLMVLRDAQMRDMVNDDRPPKFDNDLDRMPWMEQMQTRIDIVLGKYPDSLPPYTQKKIDNEEEADDVVDASGGPMGMSAGLLDVGDIFSTKDGTFKVARYTPESNLIFAARRREDGSYAELHQRRPDGIPNNIEWCFDGSELVTFKGTGKKS